MKLYNIFSKIEQKNLQKNNTNEEIKNICLNSKDVKKGDIFISIKGKKYRANQFIEEAIINGSRAIITDSSYKNNKKKIPIIYFREIKNKLPTLLNIFYSQLPSNTIAVTGTNGKTSVAWYLYNILLLNNINTSYLGTIGRYINNKKISDLINTTPDICSLFRFANEFYKKGCNYFIFEASSHGINQKRIDGFPIKIAALTNITNDHLDYHKNFKSYKNTKLKLFSHYLDNNGHAILNSKISVTNDFKKKLKKKNISLVSFGHPNSKVYIKRLSNKYLLKINKKKYNTIINLTNHYDLNNIECAVAIALCLGLKQDIIAKTLKKITRPPGRMEECDIMFNKAKVFVDFAHTPDALKNILTSLKKSIGQKPILLFGCGGDRDKSKRFTMGQIAQKYAKKVYITDDNPRTENPDNIRLSIFKGCPKGIMINNRMKAIGEAINKLKRKEVLVIAGKGHEKFQIINQRKIIFDDVKIANKFIKKRNNE